MIVSSNKGRVYKPKKGHLVIHFKSLHLLKCDQWGTNILISFLQQLISYKGLFDASLDWVGVENVTIICSCVSTTGLSSRFISLVHVFNISPPQPEDLILVFASYLSSLITKCCKNNSALPTSKILKLATALISVYNEVKTNVSAVQEPHYKFSPHDVTKWCKSILRYSTDVDAATYIDQYIIKILYYEAFRIFKDRILDDIDIVKLENILQAQLGRQTLSNDVFYIPVGPTFTSLEQLKLDEWNALVKKGIIQYEREGESLDILVIPELLHLSAKISKALSEPGGSVLLIGRAGVGRRSSVKIISALQSARLIAPITAVQPQFNNDLKIAMQYAGVQGEDVYFMVEDHILIKNGMTDLLSSLLCSGEIPNLYTTVELDNLVLGLKDDAEQENYEGNLVEFFIERVKKRLHIIVCLEYNHEKFTSILENCPALYQKCTVISVLQWSKETMQAIPKFLMDRTNLQNKDVNKQIEIVEGFSDIHSLAKPEIACPVRFITLIKTYIDIYLGKKTKISDRQLKLQAGVSKLTEARQVVADLKVKAIEQQEKLAEKQAKANAALDMISNTMKNANNQKQEMEVLKQHTEKESVQLATRKKEIEVELSEVKPLIEAARAAVGNIKTESLSEIRSLRAPPDIIRDILEGVLRLMGTQDTSWNSMKNFLSKRGVKEDIRSFDASRISADNRQAVERLLTSRKDSFDPKNSKRASVAAAPLAAWVTANVRYSLVLDKIKPLEREQNKLKQNLSNAKLQLDEISTGLTDVDTAVSVLKLQLATYTKEAAEIEIHLNVAQETLAAAEGLVHKLNDEYERWQAQLKELSGELSKLPKHCLLAAAFITYLSQEPEENREHLLNMFLKLLNMDDFSLEHFLSSEQEQLQWQSEGLSADQLSMQNAIMIFKTKMPPLVLDPTSIASDWIKKHLKTKTVEVVSQNAVKFNTILELSIRFGKVLIIEEVETISPVMLTILRKQLVYQGERRLININGKLVDYHGDFQLLLCCRNTHLQLTPDIMAVVNVINFITTRAGLAEQLLTSAIKQESPELEERRRELLRQREELQDKQHNLQNQLLEDLANSAGDILQNKNLMTSLNETKASSVAIAAALLESVNIQSKLEMEYEVYKDISSFASSLYFAISEFSNVNVLYSLSVPAYIRLFLKSLPPMENAKENFAFLHKSLLQSVYTFMSRGIFKADCLKFALHICHKMLPRQVPEVEWNLLLGQAFNGTRPDTSKVNENLPSWIPETSVHTASLLQNTLPEFYNNLKFNESTLWKSFMEKNECENDFPHHCKITEFQKILVVQAIRSDRLHSAMLLCVLRLTGLKSLNPDILHMSSIFNETLAAEPILLIAAPGTDPSSEVKELNQTKFGKDCYTEIAMGEGQEAKALSALSDASKAGNWLILKNLHLVTSWLPVLCQNLQNLQANKNFRLWLITEPHVLFSAVLARSSLKIVYEVPQGVKSNLLRTYSSWGMQYIEKLNPNGARIFFALSSIHALLQERRTYIPQGWSKAYEFNDVDLNTAVKLLSEFWQTQNMQMYFKYFIGICLDAVYGGRIENRQDLGILESYLRQYFADEIISNRWKPLTLSTSLPTYSNYEEYINVIKQLSDRDLPSYFGLPDNIQRAWEKNVSTDIISHLQGLGVMKSKTEKFSREEWQKKLLPFMSLWKKLNQGHDYIRMSIPANLTEGSTVSVFLTEEFCGAITLIQKIHKNFAILNKISRGTIAGDDQDLQLASELLTHNTPKAWQYLWRGPKDPNKYLKSIIHKTTNIAKWIEEHKMESVAKQPINMAFLFHPNTFLAAFKQDYSRKSGIPMDELTLRSNWKPSDGITVTGLLVEGALFDGYSLTPCAPNSNNITTAPDCFINWTEKHTILDTEKVLQVPLYYSSQREQLLVHLQITCSSKEKDKWIQAGLAFFVTY